MSGWLSRSTSAARMPSSVPVGGMRMSVTTTSGLLGLDRGDEGVVVLAHPDHLEVGLGLDQGPDALADEVVVLRQHDPHRHGPAL